MTYAPASMLELARYWTEQGGVNLGIVGDAAHATRASYHNGWDRAVRRLGTSDPVAIARADYTFRTSRDRVTSSAAMGLDLGRLEGSLGKLRSFSAWLVERCQAAAPGTRDIREVIYCAPDGRTVLRYDRARGVTSEPRPGEADDSHLTHTHLSFYRDSEARSKLAIVRPYFEVIDMPDKIYSVPGRRSAVWPQGTKVYAGATVATASSATSAARRYDLTGQSGPGDSPDRYLVDGAGDGAAGVMGWLPRAGMTDVRDESYNAGVQAAAAAALDAKRA